jgi:outer membrane autotransporter protein
LKANLVDADDDTTKIIAGVDATHLGTLNGSINLVLTDEDITKKIVLEGDKTGFNLDNTLYNVEFDKADTYTVSGKKNAGQIAESTGANANQAGTIEAIMSNTAATGNANFNAIASDLNNMLQSGNTAQIQTALEAVATLAPGVAPMVEQTQTETVNQVFNAVGTRLSGGAFSSSQGMSSGDAWENATVWMQGLANHTKLDTSSKSTGFKADTYGAAFGVEKKIDNDVKAGIGYAYNKTDVNSKGRDTDVKTHTLLAYGEYKPSDWFVNGIASYNWSDYKEKKNVIGNIINADYDVDALGIQVMTGYDLHNQYATITPEAGLRYMHIHGDNYTDTAGQNINFNNSNIITGVAGSKISKTIETESGLRLTPEARFAMTYDLNRAHNKSNVMLPNGSLYSINGKTLDRFGVEIGAGLTAEINYNIEMSLGYEGSFRKDYQSHSGLLDVKYKF